MFRRVGVLILPLLMAAVCASSRIGCSSLAAATPRPWPPCCALQAQSEYCQRVTSARCRYFELLKYFQTGVNILAIKYNQSGEADCASPRRRQAYGTWPDQRDCPDARGRAALAILQQALEIEEQGGLMLPDGSRRHHQVGFSFGTSPDEQKQIWAFKPRAKTA